MISTTEIPLIQEYINNFYLLLESVYNANKLVINKDKTKLMIICKQKICKLGNKLQINAGGYGVN